MKNILMTVVTVSFLVSCELVSEPPVSSESPPIANQSDASQSTSELFLGKGKKPVSGGVEYEVMAKPHVGDLESFCPGHASFKFDAMWFTHDCDPAATPFDSGIFKGNGQLNLDMRKRTFRFWLWVERKGSDVYDTGTQSFSDGFCHGAEAIPCIELWNSKYGLARGFTFHIDRAYDMTRKVKKVINTESVEFGDVDFRPLPAP